MPWVLSDEEAGRLQQLIAAAGAARLQGTYLAAEDRAENRTCGEW